MSDIGLVWDNNLGSADFTISGDDIALDDGLETSVMLSLFTNRRQDGVGGWWGDAVGGIHGDEMGSHLWTLAREKDTPTVLKRAAEIARAALAWMVTDAVAARVECTTESLPLRAGRTMLALAVTIHRPEVSSPAVYKYSYNWAAQEVRRGI